MNYVWFFQVKIASETVRLGEQYLKRADETLSQASQQLTASLTRTSVYSNDRPMNFADLGPELASFLTELQGVIVSKTTENAGSIEAKRRKLAKPEDPLLLDLSDADDERNDKKPAALIQSVEDIGVDAEIEPDLDPCIWSFLREECEMGG